MSPSKRHPISRFHLGDKVRVSGKPHMPGVKEGTVALRADSPAYGVKFPGMRTPHKWYVGSELRRVTENPYNRSGRHIEGKPGGWGYAIDYDKSIAEDEKTVRELEAVAALSQALNAEEIDAISRGFVFGSNYFLFDYKNRSVHPGRATILGLDPYDVEALAEYWEVPLGEPPPPYDPTAPYDREADLQHRKLYHHGKEVSARLKQTYGEWGESYLPTEEQRIARLKKARTQLARHKRNQGKYAKNPIAKPNARDWEGRSRGTALSSYSHRQMEMGAKHEAEHTHSLRIARRIAADHLAEDRSYYTHLNRMERDLKSGTKKNPVSRADIEDLGRAYIEGEDIAHSPEAQAMAREQAARVHREFDKLRRHIHIEFTDRDPYQTFDQMIADIRGNKRMLVYTGSSETPLWDESTNWMARAVHDWDHYQAMVDFSLAGELAAFRVSAARAPSLSPLYLSEIALQAASYHVLGGAFAPGPQKLVRPSARISRMAAELRDNPVLTPDDVLLASTLLRFASEEEVMAHLDAKGMPRKNVIVATDAAIEAEYPLDLLTQRG